MTADEFSDEILMAFADGELGPEDAVRVEAAIAADPALARRAALFTGTRDVLARAAAARPETAVPDALMAQVRETLATARSEAAESKVLQLRRPAAPIRPMAIAASLALAVGLAGGLWIGLSSGSGGAPEGLRIAALDAPGMRAALDRVPSGDRQAVEGGEIEMIASFRNADGELCREFEYDGPDRATVVSVACRSGNNWHPRFAIVAGAADSGYAPASSLATLDAYLTAIGAGVPMAADAEQEALANIRK